MKGLVRTRILGVPPHLSPVKARHSPVQFHAVVVLPEVLSNARRVGTMNGAKREESTKACPSVNSGTPAAA